MSGLSFIVRDKTDTFVQKCIGGDASADLLWSVPSIASFTIDDDDRAVAALIAPGARCSVMLGPDELFRGRVARTPGHGPKGQIEVHVEDDRRKFNDWLGWPKTTAPITGQDVEYDVYTGPSETIFKAALAANVARLGVPWTVVATQGRGSSARVELRFHKLADKLIPLLVADRLGVVLAYPENGGVVVDVRSPRVVDGLLDAPTGIVDEFDFDRWASSATRAVVGGREQGTERILAYVIDTAREAEWADIIEVFRDARNTEPGADLTLEGWQTIADGAPGASVSMDLIETDRFRFREHYDVGDIVPFNIGGAPGTEVITRVTISDTVRGGLTITPHIGDVNTDPLAQLGARVAELKARVRDLGRS
ncbi:Gp37-like protein [Microbacterium thalli]|uniref:Gp37-like protein n=1 Tax=Microbacterium thalli TaxID=3027921 RepID=UPI0023653AB8|nr:hypothetical protein [Microbacterium thalli]MDD7930064.1 hypothetical protein [Microbacterium thalli]